MPRPKAGNSLTDSEGTSGFATLAAKPVGRGGLGCVYRPQAPPDYGVDGHLEIMDEVDEGTTEATGRFLGVQVKTGSWYFRSKGADAWTVHIEKASTVAYWRGYAVPVILVIVDPRSGVAYWQRVDRGPLVRRRRGYDVQVPFRNVLDASAAAHLRATAEPSTPALLGRAPVGRQRSNPLRWLRWRLLGPHIRLSHHVHVARHTRGPIWHALGDALEYDVRLASDHVREAGYPPVLWLRPKGGVPNDVEVAVVEVEVTTGRGDRLTLPPVTVLALDRRGRAYPLENVPARDLIPMRGDVVEGVLEYQVVLRSVQRHGVVTDVGRRSLAMRPVYDERFEPELEEQHAGQRWRVDLLVHGAEALADEAWARVNPHYGTDERLWRPTPIRIARRLAARVLHHRPVARRLFEALLVLRAVELDPEEQFYVHWRWSWLQRRP